VHTYLSILLDNKHTHKHTHTCTNMHACLTGVDIGASWVPDLESFIAMVSCSKSSKVSSIIILHSKLISKIKIENFYLLPLRQALWVCQCWACIHIHMYIYTYMCIYIYVYIYIKIYIYTYTCIYMYILYICMYMYTGVYVYTYIYINVYM